MKKNLFILGLFCTALSFGFTACGDDEEPIAPPIDDGNSGGATSTVITATDAQAELENVAKKIESKINAEDYREIIELADFCEREFDGDDVAYPYNPYVAKLMRGVRTAVRGDVTAFATPRAAGEVYAGEELYGSWAWSESAGEWVMVDSNYKGLRYTFNYEGKECVVEVTESQKKYDVTYEEDGATDVVKVPATLNAGVKLAGRSLADLQVNVTELSQSGKKVALNSRLTVSKLTVNAEFADNNTTASVKGTLAIGGEQIMTAEASLDGAGLADDSFLYDEEFDGENNLNMAVAKVTLMNSVTVYAKADNKDTKLWPALDYEGYYSCSRWLNSDGEWEVSEWGNPNAEADAQVAAVAANDKVEARLAFENGTYVAPIKWQKALFYEYSYTWDTSKYEDYEWGIEPVIHFDNGAQFSFGEYFTESRFSNTIDLFENLGEEFNSFF